MRAKRARKFLRFLITKIDFSLRKNYIFRRKFRFFQRRFSNICACGIFPYEFFSWYCHFPMMHFVHIMHFQTHNDPTVCQIKIKSMYKLFGGFCDFWQPSRGPIEPILWGFVVSMGTTKPQSMASIGPREGFQKSSKPPNLGARILAPPPPAVPWKYQYLMS